ncbi:MAG: hypothetical protein WDN06_00260 [Asticcacaulis sp.]
MAHPERHARPAPAARHVRRPPQFHGPDISVAAVRERLSHAVHALDADPKEANALIGGQAAFDLRRPCLRPGRPDANRWRGPRRRSHHDQGSLRSRPRPRKTGMERPSAATAGRKSSRPWVRPSKTATKA